MRCHKVSRPHTLGVTPHSVLAGGWIPHSVRYLGEDSSRMTDRRFVECAYFHGLSTIMRHQP